MFSKRFAPWVFLLSLCLAPECLCPSDGQLQRESLLKNHSLERRHWGSIHMDLAEIPTYQEMQQGNITAKADDPAVLAFVAAQGRNSDAG